MYEYDSNAILAEPIKNRQTETIYDALFKVHKVLKARVNHPKVYITEKKCSSDLKEAMKKYKIDFQMAPPHTHRLNAAERAIRTYKDHFIYGFSTTDPDFPIRK